MTAATSTHLLDIDNLSVGYRTGRGIVQAVQNVTIGVEPGRAVGLVGESGSGKSTVAAAVLRLLPANASITSGSIRFNDVDLADLPDAELARRWRWRELAMVFQRSLSALSPVHRVGAQLHDVLALHEPKLSERQRDRADPGVAGRRSPPGAGPACLPVRAFGRDDAADDDRARAPVQAALPDLRRGDDRARRDHPGPDPARDQPPQARFRPDDSGHLARCRGDQRHRRYGRRPLRGPTHGGRAARDLLLRPGAPVLPRPDRVGPPPERHEGADRRDSGLTAGLAIATTWLPVRAPLPARDAEVRRGGAADDRDRARAPGAVRVVSGWWGDAAP